MDEGVGHTNNLCNPSVLKGKLLLLVLLLKLHHGCLQTLLKVPPVNQ